MPTESPLPRKRPIVAPSLDERAAAAAGIPAARHAVHGAPAAVAVGMHTGRAKTSVPAPSHAEAPVARPVAQGASRRADVVAAAVILGVDPGTRVVGWGAIALSPRGPRLLAAGVIRAGDGDLVGRLGLIRRELDRLIALYRPGVVAVEEAFAHKNVQSALRIGEGRGVVLSCAGAAGIAVHQYPPASAKKALVGNGAAHKTQVAAMVARRLGLDEAPKPLDASDALALALTHAIRARP